MPDEDGQVIEEPEGTDGNDPESVDAQTQTPVPEATPKPPPAGKSVEDLQKQLSQVNAESAQRRIRIKELEGQLHTAQQTVAEKDKTIVSLQELSRGLTVKNTFLQAAREKGFTFPSPTAEADALQFLPMDGVVISEDFSTVTGVTEALDALAASRPYLFTKPVVPDLDGARGSDNQPVPAEDLAGQFGIMAPRAQP